MSDEWLFNLSLKSFHTALKGHYVACNDLQVVLDLSNQSPDLIFQNV